MPNRKHRSQSFLFKHGNQYNINKSKTQPWKARTNLLNVDFLGAMDQLPVVEPKIEPSTIVLAQWSNERAEE